MATVSARSLDASPSKRKTILAPLGSEPGAQRERPRFVAPDQSLTLVDGWAVVKLTGEHDLATLVSVTKTLREARAASRRVIVDLGRCDYIDSTIVNLLVRVSSDVTPGSFALLVPRGTPALVLRVLEITCLERAVSIHESLPTSNAIASGAPRNPGTGSLGQDRDPQSGVVFK